MSRQPKSPPVPTITNLYALASALADSEMSSPDGVLRRVDAVSRPHITRTLHAGFLEPAPSGIRGEWVLSERGCAAFLDGENLRGLPLSRIAPDARVQAAVQNACTIRRSRG